MIILSLISFITKFNYLLCALLTMELMVLIIMTYLIFYLKMFFFLGLNMYFIIFSVCEGCLGISLLVFMMRNFGSDYMYMYSLL